MSFTLYLTHYPLLLFLSFAILSNHPWNPDSRLLWVGIAITITAYVYGFVIAHFTEAYTGKLRRAILRLIRPPESVS